MKKIKELTALLLLLPTLYAAGQSASVSDTSMASKLYYETRGEALPIFNGRDFFDQYAAIEGSAFFETDEWTKGQVIYENVLYPDVRLKYDIYRDELLILPPGLVPIVVFSERVQGFSYNGLRFVRLQENKKEGIKAGFYQILSSGELTIYAKRQRALEEEIVDLRVDRSFSNAYKFYSLMNGKFRSFSKQSQLLELTGNRKAAINQQIKAKNLRYKENREAVITLIADSYNQTKL